jgi:hypothetical protein
MQIQEIIYLSIAVGTTVFSVFLYFRKPQEKSEVNDAVFNEKFLNLKLSTDEKFKEMVTGFNKSIELALNHSHTVEVKIDSHIKESQTKGELDARWQGRIETLLEERLPKK